MPQRACRRPAAAGFVAPALVGVAEPPNALSPRGPVGADIATLWWVMFAVGMVVFVAVVVLLALASMRRRDDELGHDVWTGEGFAAGGNLLVALGGVIVPGVIVVALMVLTVTTSARLAQLGADEQPLVVEVTAHQFWWDVRYPDHSLRVANEVHLPVGTPVEFHVTSRDVIHSFWIPPLGGKVDVNPGHTNTLRLRADEAGVYRGMCGEYCGIQHARMQFIAVAHEPDDFARWLDERAEPRDEPQGDAAAGQDVFMEAGCAECHTVEGVSPGNDDYPDLTHLANRRTIGAGTVSNNRGNLGGWILDPQGIKPGNRMPPANLGGEDLQALLDYLGTLK